MLGAGQYAGAGCLNQFQQCNTMQKLIGVFGCALRQQKGVSQVRKQGRGMPYCPRTARVLLVR